MAAAIQALPTPLTSSSKRWFGFRSESFLLVLEFTARLHIHINEEKWTKENIRMCKKHCTACNGSDENSSSTREFAAVLCVYFCRCSFPSNLNAFCILICEKLRFKPKNYYTENANQKKLSLIHLSFNPIYIDKLWMESLDISVKGWACWFESTKVAMVDYRISADIWPFRLILILSTFLQQNYGFITAIYFQNYVSNTWTYQTHCLNDPFRDDSIIP